MAYFWNSIVIQWFSIFGIEYLCVRKCKYIIVFMWNLACEASVRGCEGWISVPKGLLWLSVSLMRQHLPTVFGGFLRKMQPAEFCGDYASSFILLPRFCGVVAGLWLCSGEGCGEVVAILFWKACFGSGIEMQNESPTAVVWILQLCSSELSISDVWLLSSENATSISRGYTRWKCLIKSTMLASDGPMRRGRILPLERRVMADCNEASFW